MDLQTLEAKNKYFQFEVGKLYSVYNNLSFAKKSFPKDEHNALWIVPGNCMLFLMYSEEKSRYNMLYDGEIIFRYISTFDIDWFYEIKNV